MKTTISEKRRAAPVRRRPKRRLARRAHGRRGSESTSTKEPPVPAPAAPFYEVAPDKRDEELSDEEALDREERQELY